MDADSPADAVVEFLAGPDEPNVGGLDRAWRAAVGPLLLAGVALVVVGVVDLPTRPATVPALAAAGAVGAIVTHSAVACRCRVNHLSGVDTSGE